MNMSDDFPMMMEREFGMRDDVPMVLVAFGLFPMKDGRRSDECGYDVYKDVEHVKIAVPGDRNSLFFQPASEQHRRRFPQAYAAYKSRENKPMEGKPIEDWAPVSRSMALNLRAMHINTVEALAAVHEGHIDRIGTNGRELRSKAIAWLAEAKTGAETMRLAAEKQDLQDQLEAMKAQIAALAANQMPMQGDDGAAARKPRAKV